MREAQWVKFHAFEKRQKRHFLKQLTAREAYNILRQLYAFAYNSSGKLSFNILDKEKIKTLARVHLIFGRTKV